MRTGSPPRAQRRKPLAAARECPPNRFNGNREAFENYRGRQPHDTIPKPTKLPVPARVSLSTPNMRATVNFND
jgi:hypothetical protein